MESLQGSPDPPATGTAEKSGSRAELPRTARIGFVVLTAAALAVGAVALLLKAPVGTTVWASRAIALVLPPLGFIVLVALFGRMVMPEGRRRAPWFYGGLAGMAVYAAIGQVTAPSYVDFETYRPSAVTYQLTMDPGLESFVIDQWQLGTSREFDPDRINLFVAAANGEEVGGVVVFDLQTTDLTADDLNATAADLTTAMVRAGAAEADPITVNGRRVLVYEFEGDRLGFWLESNLLLMALAGPDDFDRLVTELNSE
jgi:hypothetical protein